MASRPKHRFQGVISATVFGLLSFVSGVIGLDLRHSHGWFAGVKWADGPVWLQVMIGAALLVVAVVLARRALRE